MSTFLGNVLALALRETRTAEGWNFNRAAAIVANADRLDRKRKQQRKWMKERASMRQEAFDPRPEMIVTAIENKYLLRRGELKRPLRLPKLVRKRDEAIWEMRQLTPPVSYPNCARAVGLTNHTSAISAFHRHARRLESLSTEPQIPAGTGGAPASPAHTLPVPAGRPSPNDENIR